MRTLWNACPEFEGIMCSRYSDYNPGGYRVTPIAKLGLRWDWGQEDTAAIKVLRDNIVKRHRDWVDARNDLESALKSRK